MRDQSGWLLQRLLRPALLAFRLPLLLLVILVAIYATVTVRGNSRAQDALAEVRDLTAVRDEDGVVQRLPEFDISYRGNLPGAFEWSVGASAVSFEPILLW